MSSPAMNSMSESVATPPNNMAADLKPQGQAAQKYKPCCVCKDEKASRDECMLFSNAADPQKDCESFVGKYRSCMKSYGFNIA
ncbi:hypothetical protein MBLNU457_g0665t1 [Dothideomycetes sp. NU457]